MDAIRLVEFGVPVAVCVTLVWLIVRTAKRSHAAPTTTPVRSLLLAARRRALIAILFASIVVFALFAIDLQASYVVGLAVGLAPALGGAAGMALYAATPPRAMAVDAAAPREASLTPRTALSFVPRGEAIAYAALVVAQIAFLVFTGVTSGPDEWGRYREFHLESGAYGSHAGPYAGWFYGVPLLIATLVLVVATFLALWRVSSTPALPQHEHADLDAQWRRETNRILLALSAAALLLQFGGVAVMSGFAIQNTASGFFLNGVLTFLPTATAWQAVGVTLAVGGIILMIASVVMLTLAVLWAIALPGRSSARGSRVAPVQPAGAAG